MVKILIPVMNIFLTQIHGPQTAVGGQYLYSKEVINNSPYAKKNTDPERVK